jgi:hypothetical protein
MKCPYCGNDANYGPNEEFYGRRFGRSYMCYYCKPCDAYVGTHNNTTKPLGTLANQELRDWRKKAHAAFDPFWQKFEMTRKDAYEMLKTKFGREIHIGEADVETCKRIIDLTKY